MSLDNSVEAALVGVLQKRNDAWKVNEAVGGLADLQITEHGSNWYWAVFALMTVAALAFIGHSLTRPRTHRLWHYIAAGITMVSAIAYYSMATNLGKTPIPVEFYRSSRNDQVGGRSTRAIFYVRYIDWFITTPLILLSLLLTADMPWPTILWTILVDMVMIVCGLVGALTRTRHKWGYYAFGCAALLFILYQLLWEARRHAFVKGKDIGRVFFMGGALTGLLWLLYPIAWGLSEGGNVIHPDSEGVFYGVLDILSKVAFGAIMIWGHRNIDPRRLGLHIREYDEDPAIAGPKGYPTGVDGYQNDPVLLGGVHGTNGVNRVGNPHDTVTGTAVV